MTEEKNKVKVKVVKHIWEDEKAMIKAQKRQRVILVCAIIVSFIIGFIIGPNILTKHDTTIVTTTNTNTDLSILESAYNIMLNKWYFGKDNPNLSTELINAAIRGMVSTDEDPHTVFMDSEQIESFTSSLDNSIIGIGVKYSVVDNKVLVREVVLDSPAEKAGLLAGDYITHVDGKTIESIGDENLQTAIQGEVGTDVVVRVERAGQTKDYTITRAEIYISVTSRVLTDNVGYIEISSFSDDTAEELKMHLDDLTAKNVSKLIIDVRNNGGGYLSTLLSMCSFFLDANTVVLQQELREGTIETGYTKEGKYKNFDKIVLLTNENSASCSEVFAAALREQAKVKIVGTTTYGKGTVQVTWSFADGSALKYTTAAWLTPKGESIDGVGVVPDYEVKLHPALYLSPLQFEEGEQYKYDNVDEKIKNAQIMLDFLGYSVDRTDGYFSIKTKTAIAAFQNDSHITSNGILNLETANALNSNVIREWGTNSDKYDTQLKKALEVIHE